MDRRTRVRLRVVNAAAATSFWIDTGGLAARLVAVDGHEIKPTLGTRFGMAMAHGDHPCDPAGSGRDRLENSRAYRPGIVAGLI